MVREHSVVKSERVGGELKRREGVVFGFVMVSFFLFSPGKLSRCDVVQGNLNSVSSPVPYRSMIILC